MKNREKFAKEILDIACKGGSIAVTNFGDVVNCNDFLCELCMFDRYHNNKDCGSTLHKWSESEYIEKPIITSREKMFLDLLLPKYKYIARDGNTNKLFLYIDKPSKHSEYWLSEEKDVNRIRCDVFDVKLDFIKWEDEEPWSIEELKKLEVKDE